MKCLSLPVIRHSLLAACMVTATATQAATQTQILDAALINGDSSQLTDSHLVAQRLQQRQNQIAKMRSDLLVGLYGNIDSFSYIPTKNSQWIGPGSMETTLPFLIGDKGNVLAALSVDAGGRAVAYGSNILSTLGSSNALHIPLFKRAVSWLVTGSAAGAVPASFKVSVVGTTSSSVLSGLTAAGFVPTDAGCNALTDAACASASKLLVIGNSVTASDTLSATVNARMKAGLPILYVNTSSWGGSTPAAQILDGLALEHGPYGGNFWASDEIANPGNMAKTIALSKDLGLDHDLAKRIVDKGWRQDYPWGNCNDTECSRVPGFEILANEVEAVRKKINTYNAAGKNIFTTPGTTVTRLWVLWADAIRQNLHYPIDKIKEPSRFQETYTADALIGYVREAGNAQKDLGTYASNRQATMPVSSKEETLTVILPSASGFTAIGRMAVPGKRVSIKVEQAEGDKASFYVFMNTMRTGSTYLWDPDKYNRPRFISSPALGLQPGKALSMVGPYGGTLQLSYSGATPGQKVTVKVTGAAHHPFLDLRPEEDNSLAISNFASALNEGKADWVELRSGTVEVHSKADMMLSTVNKEYRGDVQRLSKEINELFVGSAYSLGGFVVPGQQLSAGVTRECQRLGWDCTSEALHKMPGTQHINVDLYAACGSGCSGNPYDQSWDFNPRGWGESHELGHNLQVGRLKVYGGISAEVSNQIFPLYKNWRMFRELGVDMSPTRVNYRKAFDLIVASRGDADPVKGAYDRIWKDPGYAVQNGERMAFYTQWVHYWGALTKNPPNAWDIWTLMYLHQRMVADADWDSYKARLGYSTYAARPSDGNDNLLIGLSWLTLRDQRPTFAMWGITTSAAAQAQVQSYGFATQPAFFYANITTNDYSKDKLADMSPQKPIWPYDLVQPHDDQGPNFTPPTVEPPPPAAQPPGAEGPDFKPPTFEPLPPAVQPPGAEGPDFTPPTFEPPPPAVQPPGAEGPDFKPPTFEPPPPAVQPPGTEGPDFKPPTFEPPPPPVVQPVGDEGPDFKPPTFEPPPPAVQPPGAEGPDFKPPTFEPPPPAVQPPGAEGPDFKPPTFEPPPPAVQPPGAEGPDFKPPTFEPPPPAVQPPGAEGPDFKPPTVEPPAVQPPAGGKYDFVFPDGLKNYKAGTKVRARDGNIYSCKPWPYNGYCVQWTDTATQYEPGFGSHWQMAWTRD